MKNGRIAVPSMNPGGLDAQRAGHFGHCDAFTLVDVTDGEISSVTVIPNVEHGQGGCMVPVQLLAQNNVNAIIVGGMGMRPLMGFKQVGIDVYFNDVHPVVKTAVQELVDGNLQLMNDMQVCGGGQGECGPH